MEFKKKKVYKTEKTIICVTTYKEGQDPIPCAIVGSDGSKVGFFSVKAAKRALAGLIQTLPKRKPGEEKRFTIEK